MQKYIDLKKVFLQIFYDTLNEYEKGNRQKSFDKQIQDFFNIYKGDYAERLVTSFPEKSAAILDLPGEASDILKETAKAVETDQALKAFFSYCCDVFYNEGWFANSVDGAATDGAATDGAVAGDEPVQAGFLSSDELFSRLGKYSPLFSVLVLLPGVERLEAAYIHKKIGKDILAETLGDIKVWMLNSHKRYGIWGGTPFSWFFSYLSGRLFKLGRLQFAPAPFWGSVIAFKNISTREVVAFTEPGICFRKDGLINGTNNIYDTEGTFVSEYEANDSVIKGNLILPGGTVQREITILESSKWQQVLKKGDILLGVHIPEGGKMDYDQCGASFSMAVEFFKKIFPELSYKGFSCGSWLLDPQLRLLLPQSSNIVRFQKEFYLFPVQSSDEAVIDRVFGCEREDFEKVPIVTALQRCIKDYMNAGGKLHSAGMFLLTEDLQWGSQVYQGRKDGCPEVV